MFYIGNQSLEILDLLTNVMLLRNEQEIMARRSTKYLN